MQGKQAKSVSPNQERAMLGYLVTNRYPARDRVMITLSMKAGLRDREMAAMSTGCAGIRRTYHSSHVATRHRRRYGGQTQGRPAPVKLSPQDSPCGAAHLGPGICHTRAGWRRVQGRGLRPPRRVVLSA